MWGPFPIVTVGAWLSRLSEDGADPFTSPCRMGLQLERELGGLIWKSPIVGLGVPSFFIEVCCGPGDQERWALA